MAGSLTTVGSVLTRDPASARAATPASDEQPPLAAATAAPPPAGTNRADQLDALIDNRPSDVGMRDRVRSIGQGIRDLFIPRNVDQTMTKDYLPTRMWWMGREVMTNLSYGFAASQATALALEMVVKSQPGAAVATIGLGLGMYWFPKVVDQIRNVTSMATSTVAPVADRRPKAWFLAGDVLDNVGNAVMSCAALVPSAYAPLSIGVGAAFTIAGVLKRRAQSNMFYRQAIDPMATLPEINTKENNQSILLNLVSVAAGAGLQYALSGTSLAAALPVVGCLAAAAGIATTVKFLSNLDMENVNETVVRKAVDCIEQGQELPAPDRRVSRLPAQLLERDRIELGRDLDRLKQSGTARYQALLQLYKDDRYILESYKGRPYIVVKQGAERPDATAAMVQAIHLERLAATPEFEAVLAQKGSDAADYWLVEQSLAKARQQAPGLLDRLGARGWAVDLVNFKDTDERYSDEQLKAPLEPGQVALP